MIPKILWPTSNLTPHPFGGAKGMRPLSLTFHSRIEEGISDKEKQALEILDKLVGPHEIDVMSFDGRHYPKILFEPSRSVDDCTLRIVDSNGKLLTFPTPIPAAYILKDRVISLMSWYSSDREQEFLLNRDDLLEADAHYALCRDIFVTTSMFLIENREKLEELNIRTPSEALKIVGLYIRTSNEHEWISEVRGNVYFHMDNQRFYWFLARAKLPNYWRFATGLGQYLDRESLSPLLLSVHRRCEKAFRARDEIAKLFYSLGTRDSDSRLAYHFDYLALLLAGALDAMAEMINLLYELGIKGFGCSLNPKRDGFMKALQKKSEALPLFNYLSDHHTASFLNMLYQLRNKIHTVSLDSNIIVPENDVEEVIDALYSYDPENHLGISKQKVQASTNGGSLIPSYDITIDRYNLAYQLVEDGLKLIDKIMNLLILA
jgi:hypothetical protein